MRCSQLNGVRLRELMTAMRWSHTDLENRVVVTESKTGPVAIPLSMHAVEVLRQLYERAERELTED